jgi:hypothetical protein
MGLRRDRPLPSIAEIGAAVILVVLLPCSCLFLLASIIPTEGPATEKDLKIIASEFCRQAEREGLLQDAEGVSSSDQAVIDVLSGLSIQSVQRQDTDGDGQKEWVVFYQFDLTNRHSPYAGAIYDFDRGNPPILFPYRLLPPDRDYLSEGNIELVFDDVVKLGELFPVSELLVYGRVGDIYTDLTIFRHHPNSLPWEFPRDEPRAYQVIGAFRGDGGVSFDLKTKRVTVLNRAGYDRSQLAVETVYALDEARGTYMSLANPEQLGAPVSSKVVFAFGMPPDILNTPYPEKLVLGFYESLAQEQPAIEPHDFLTGQALTEYDRGNLAYFGFGDVSGKVNQVSITQLSYASEVEQINPSITVLGEEPRFLIVSVDFEAQVGKTDMHTTAPIQWFTTMVNGKWKIDRRL